MPTNNTSNGLRLARLHAAKGSSSRLKLEGEIRPGLFLVVEERAGSLTTGERVFNAYITGREDFITLNWPWWPGDSDSESDAAAV